MFRKPRPKHLVVTQLAVQQEFSSKSALVHCVFLHAGPQSAARRSSGIKIQVLK